MQTPDPCPLCCGWQAIGDGLVSAWGNIQVTGLVEKVANEPHKFKEPFLKLLFGTLEMLAANKEASEEWPKQLQEAMTRIEVWCKASLCALHPVPLCMGAAFTHVQQIQRYSGASFLETELKTAFKVSEFWKAYVQDAEKKAAIEQQIAPELIACAVGIVHATAPIQKFQALKKALHTCRQYSAQLRDGGIMDLENVMFDHVVEASNDIMNMDALVLRKADVEMAVLQEILQLAINEEGHDKYKECLAATSQWSDKNRATLNEGEFVMFHEDVMQNPEQLCMDKFSRLVQLLPSENVSDEHKVRINELVYVLISSLQEKAPSSTCQLFSEMERLAGPGDSKTEAVE